MALLRESVSGSLIMLQSRCRLKLQSSQGLTRTGKSNSKLTHMVVFKLQFLAGCWLEASVRHQSRLSNRAVHKHGSWLPAKASDPREQQCISKTEATVFL